MWVSCWLVHCGHPCRDCCILEHILLLMTWTDVLQWQLRPYFLFCCCTKTTLLALEEVFWYFRDSALYTRCSIKRSTRCQIANSCTHLPRTSSWLASTTRSLKRTFESLYFNSLEITADVTVHVCLCCTIHITHFEVSWWPCNSVQLLCSLQYSQCCHHLILVLVSLGLRCCSHHQWFWQKYNKTVNTEVNISCHIS